MEIKKILIVSERFYPRNSPRSYRATELAKQLARAGHKVVVLIPFKGYDYTDFGRENNIVFKNLGNLRLKSIKIKGGRLEMFVRRVFRRLLELLFVYPDIEIMYRVSNILKKENGYDLLISIAVPFPVHWGVAKARTKEHKIAKVWVADCGDPFMGDTLDSFGKFFYFKYVEKWFCRKADYISVPFDGAKSGYYNEFHNKIKIIPQGFQFDNLNIPSFKKVHNFPVFAYTGGFIPGITNHIALLKFLSTCNRKFKFIVYTSYPEILFPFKETLGEKLEINEYIPFEDHIDIISRMDFLINFEYTEIQRPSKLIIYGISGRPVLNIASESDFSSLLEFMDGNYSKKMHLESVDNYDIRIVAEKFTQLKINP